MRIEAVGTDVVATARGRFVVAVIITRGGIPIRGDVVATNRADAEAIKGLTGAVAVTEAAAAAGSGAGSTP